jgi:gamma-glutamyltranspeptidase / glutathione hydrolase
MMGLITDDGQARNTKRNRQLRSLALGAVFLLSACGRSETIDPNAVNPGGNPAGNNAFRANYMELHGDERFFSGISADESQAAEVGRSILQGGGNATDAAVAMYFAMAVTLPSAAGLGAMGACVVHDATSRAGEAFVFGPVAAPGPIKGVTITVPSGVRAMVLMQSRHGRARWEMDVAAGEKLARFGVPVSRALARDLRASSGLLDDGAARHVFTKDGVPLSEGDNLVQTDLASTLGTVRQGGGVNFFQGNFTRVLSEQVAQAGGSLPPELLRATAPQFGPPTSDKYGGYRVYVAPPPMAGASALAGWAGQPAPAAGAPTDSGGFSGFAAIDEKGNAAACSLTMGQLFGSRVIIPGTGMMLGTQTANSTAVSPVVIGNPNNGEVKFAGAGGGSPEAAYATGVIARATVDKEISVRAALVRHAGRGGYVNAIACPDGIKSGAGSCQTGVDPAGAGLALVATDK